MELCELRHVGIFPDIVAGRDQQEQENQKAHPVNPTGVLHGYFMVEGFFASVR